MSMAIKHVLEKITGRSVVNNEISTDSKPLYAKPEDGEEDID